MEYAKALYEGGTSALLHSWLYLDQLRYLTPYQADAAQAFITIAVIMVAIKAWSGPAFAGTQKMLAVCVAGPLSLVVLIHVEDAERGAPDDRCAWYENGKLVYVFLGHIEMPITGDRMGDTYVVLTVMSPKRWGDESHQCRLRRSDPKVKDLIGKLKAQIDDAGEGGGAGYITFSFGGGSEKPNVTYRKKPRSDGKEVPPEVSVPHDA